MTPREFAIEVVRQLQAAGYQALWAGGCVRDQELGKSPADYDIATSALPDEVREVLGKRRTIPIGEAFGVITVLGPSTAGMIEIATFRRDGGYSDGRRPDHVEFTDDCEDAHRRDFTINGMFFDPINQKVIDYVGGREDLHAGLVRAIGNPHERFAEDKLRMLRGVRFASTFGFALDPITMAAIQEHAGDIRVVSSERIGNEMRRILAGPRPAAAASLLRESGLLTEIVPDGDLLFDNEVNWNQTLAKLERLSPGNFESAAVILLESIIERDGVETVFERWRLSNQEKKTMAWICRNWPSLDRATDRKWSEIQPMLLNPAVLLGLEVAESQGAEPSDGVSFCNERLNWPREKLDPDPLLDGADLIKMGITPGPRFRELLDTIRAGQLDGSIETAEQAMQIVRQP